MSSYKLQIKQVVDYPKCRIYRQLIQYLIKDPNIRSCGSSGLFYYTVLCCYANFRTSFKKFDGISYTIYPGDWICRINELNELLRCKSNKQTIDILENLQDRHLIKYSLLGRGKLVKFTVINWRKTNRVLDYNAPCQKETGFFFLPISIANELVMAFKSNLSIITGSPGTGKTTVLKAIIEVFKALNPNGKIKLAAPTGRASRRMAESTGQDDASTLHSLLGLQGEDGYFNKNKEFEPIDADLIIVDESSMIDMWLARQFFVRVKSTTRVVLVGDIDQLQSVGAGDVFRELINCGLIPVTVLDQIFRQEAGSRIAINAKAINNDQTKLSYGDDFCFYKCQTQDQAADIIQRVFCDLVKVHGIENVQILSPNRKKGSAATNQLNPTIREMVNPYSGGLPDLKVGSNYFRVGDKVMQNKNNAKASNGDIGFIRDISTNEENETVITIEFAADRKVEYLMEDMKHIELAYATTVHKAMGSEYDIVIMPVIKSHFNMLKRNLVYTGITRAKHKVILIGQIGMLCMAIHKNETGNRNTALGERIKNYKKVYDIEKEIKKAS